MSDSPKQIDQFVMPLIVVVVGNEVAYVRKIMFKCMWEKKLLIIYWSIVINRH